jgi:hypothetical protein
MRLCKQAEYIDYGLTAKQLSDNLDTVYDSIANENFEFTINRISQYYLTHDLPNKLIIRKLNDNIKRIYKDEQANRRIIIAQVKTLLSETCPYWVIKTDIKSFYESIGREKIISKFHDDSLLSYHSMHLLKKVFSNPTLAATSGVPRGMNISATLSEIYMRKFDKWIRRFEGVYYYARFVDDIIIFSNSLTSSINLIQNLDSKLSELAEGLKTNYLKTELFDGRTLKAIDIKNGKALSKLKQLEYLGYSFIKEKEQINIEVLKSFKNVEKLKYTVETKYSTILHERISFIDFATIQSSKENILKVTIADKKLKKIKTRIIKALFDFGKNKDFALLEKRIMFLTGNYSIRKSEEGNDLRAGIYYNYLQVNDFKVFEELNSFFRKAIFSKATHFASKIALTPPQRRQLSKYCFIAGFKLKVYYQFTYAEIKQIINCW